MKLAEMQRIIRRQQELKLLISQCQDREIDAQLQKGKLKKLIDDQDKIIYAADEKIKHAQKAILESIP
jgi:hypothetical protein